MLVEIANDSKGPYMKLGRKKYRELCPVTIGNTEYLLIGSVVYFTKR